MPARGIVARPASRPVRPYVPKEEPTQTGRFNPAELETLPPEDPEELYARLKRNQRRRRSVVVVLSLAALLIGVAVLLDRGLVESPTGFSSFGEVDLPEAPDLGETWVAKALDEAKQARDAEKGPRGEIRPLAGGAKGQAASNGTSPTPAPAPDAETADPGTAAAARARPREEKGRTRPAPGATAPSAPRQAVTTPAPERPSAAGEVPSAPVRASASRAPTPASGTSSAEALPAGTAAGSGTAAPRPPEDGKAARSGQDAGPSDTAPSKEALLTDAPAVTIISAAEGEAEDADAFYEDTQPEAPLDPEQLRPRNPWPVPRGTPPASGRVGSFSLVTLPSAEVLFRDHPLGTTPLHSQQLPSGRQRLILIGPDGVRRVLILDVHADENTEVQLPISRLMPESLMP